MAGEKKKKKQYFAEKEEQAVVDYIESNSFEEKNRIYNEILIEPFRKMIESILRRYPIHIGNYDIKEVESNALTHLIEKMVTFKCFIIERRVIDGDKWHKLGEKYRFMTISDVTKKMNTLNDDKEYEYRIFKSKAFSYCQTIIRNYYKDHSKKSYIEKTINLPYDDYASSFNNNNEHSYELNLDEHHELELLMDTIITKIQDKIDNDSTLKKLEIAVGDAIINILKNYHVLFMEDSPDGVYKKRVTNKFEKNKILLYLKEQTGLTTKEIRLGSKPFKDLYFMEKDNFFDD